MAKSGPTPDIFDSVIRDVLGGSRKSGLGKKAAAKPNMPQPDTTPAVAGGALVDKIAAWLSSLDDATRQKVTDAFTEAVARVEQTDSDADDEAPASAEPTDG